MVAGHGIRLRPATLSHGGIMERIIHVQGSGTDHSRKDPRLAAVNHGEIETDFSYTIYFYIEAPSEQDAPANAVGCPCGTL
jgi:hypothetical protein